MSTYRDGATAKNWRPSVLRSREMGRVEAPETMKDLTGGLWSSWERLIEPPTESRGRPRSRVVVRLGGGAAVMRCGNGGPGGQPRRCVARRRRKHRLKSAYVPTVYE